MKKINKIFTAALIIASMSVHGIVSYAQNSWDFEDFTDGEAITDGNGITVSADSSDRNSYVNAVDDNGNIAAKIGFDAGEAELNSAPYLQADFDKTTDGYFSVGFRLKYGTLPSSKSKMTAVFADFLDSEGNTIAQMKISGLKYATINYVGEDGDKKSQNKSVSNNKWYEFEFVFDLSHEVYGYSVDGDVSATDMPLYDCYSSENGIAALRVYSDTRSKNASGIYLDEITVGEYMGVNITEATADSAVISDADIISADTKQLTFTFETAIDSKFAVSENVILENSVGEAIDISSEFSEDNTMLTVTVNEKLDRYEQYSVRMLLTDFTTTDFDFLTEPRENYIKSYKFVDSGNIELTEQATEGAVRFVFEPAGTAENVTAIILVHDGDELVDIAMKTVPNNEEAEIEINIEDSSYTVSAFVIDSFETRIPLMKQAYISEKEISVSSADEQKTEINFDDEELSVTFGATLSGIERAQQVSWFLVNPKIPDYTFADVNEDNIKEAILDAGAVALSPKTGNAFTFEKQLGDDPEIGRYLVWFADNESLLEESQKVVNDVYINEQAIADALNSLKSASADTFADLMEYYTTQIIVLNVDLNNEAYKNYKDEVVELMMSMISDCEEPADVEEIFGICTVLVNLNNLSEGRVDWISENNDILGIDFSGDFVTYELTNADLDTYLEKRKFTNVSDLNSEMREAFAMAVINSIDASERSKYNEVLSEYNDIFLLDLSNSLYTQNSVNVYRAFANGVGTTPTEVKSKFDDWLSNLGNSSSGGTTGSSSGGSSGGGGSGGGGGGGYSSNYPSLPTSSEVNNVIKQSAAPVFTDLEEAAWAKDYITSLYDKKIVAGDGSGYFKPNSFIKREEGVKMIMSAFDFAEQKETREFADVLPSDWYYSYVQEAVKSNIINGVDENNFGTGRNITRAEIAAILYRCIVRAEAEISAEEKAFTDSVMIPDFAAEAVNALASIGVISGREDGSFDPDASATRAEFSKMLDMVIEFIGGAANE